MGVFPPRRQKFDTIRLLMTGISFPSQTIGVISDTHLPDRSRKLDPSILEIFSNAKVSQIFHAGDISTPSVLKKLAKVAPVHAVRGNRDWTFIPPLPRIYTTVINGVSVGLTHGHGSLKDYLVDKGYYLFDGYQFERYQQILFKLLPTSRVIIFGHTHHAENIKIGERLLFNPGTASLPDDRNQPPSIGLLHFHSNSSVNGEIIRLD